MKMTFTSMNVTNNNVTDNCDLNYSQTSRGLFGSFLIAIAIVGTIGNSILSYFVIRNTEMRSLINILLANMAISDALLSLFSTPLDFLSTIHGTWGFGKTICCLHSFFVSVLVVQSVTILVIISVDRYCILVQKKDRLRGCHVATVISVCTLFSVVVSCPPLFDVDKAIVANEYCRQTYKTSDAGRLYPFLYSSFLFVLPCGLLLLAYVHIIVAIRKSTRRISPEFRSTVTRLNAERHLRINVKFKQKTFSTILYLYAAAMICKLPLAMSIFVQSFTGYAVCPMAHWIMLLMYLNSAINPFIYAFKINEYWMMITGKFQTIKNRVLSIRRRSRKRSEPQNIYMISTGPRGSVI